MRSLATFALFAPVVWLGTTLLALLTPAVTLALRLAIDGFGLSPAFGARAWASGLVLTVSSGILVLGLVLALALMLGFKRHGDIVAASRARKGFCVCAVLTLFWAASGAFGSGQLRQQVIGRMQRPGNSTDVSASAAFGFGPVGEPEFSMPYHWCTTRAVGPGLVVANWGMMRGLLNGDGQSAVFLWLFGGTWKLLDIGYWNS